MPELVGIIGAGLAGLTVGALCHKNKWSYRILTDKAPKPSPKRLLLNPNSIRVLNKLGIQPKILKSYPTLLVNQRYGLGCWKINAKDYQLPSIAYAVAYNDLLSQLLAAVEVHIDPLLDVQANEEIAVITASTTHRFSYLMACDGQNSRCRKAFNIKRQTECPGHAKIIECDLDAEELMLRFSHNICGAVLPGSPDQIILSGPENLENLHIDKDSLQMFFANHVQVKKVQKVNDISFQNNLALPNPDHRCLLLGQAAISVSPVAAQGFNHFLAQIDHLTDPQSLSKLDTISQKIHQDNQQLFNDMQQLTQHPLRRRLLFNLLPFFPFAKSAIIAFGNRYEKSY